MTEKVEFKPPKEFRAPEDVPMGEDWDMVCSFQTKPDGTICMTKIGDTPMPGYGKREYKESKPDYKAMAGQMQQGMGGEGGGY